MRYNISIIDTLILIDSARFNKLKASSILELLNAILE